jgi:hypothetical protein
MSPTHRHQRLVIGGRGSSRTRFAIRSGAFHTLNHRILQMKDKLLIPMYPSNE